MSLNLSTESVYLREQKNPILSDCNEVLNKLLHYLSSDLLNAYMWHGRGIEVLSSSWFYGLLALNNEDKTFLGISLVPNNSKKLWKPSIKLH